MKRKLFGAFAALTLSVISAHAQAQESLRMAQVSLLVKDYEAALKFYTGSLGFTKTQDRSLGKERWITIAPPGQKGAELVLVKPETPADDQAVGKQAGERTFLVLETTKFDDTYKQYQDKGVKMDEVSAKPWGKQAMLTDLYGNRLVLLEVKPRQ